MHPKSSEQKESEVRAAGFHCVQSMNMQRAAFSASHFHHQCSSHSLEGASFKPRMCVLYDSSFHTLIPAPKRGDAACRRTTSAVKQKMGHRHKHQRHQPIVSLSKYTEFRYTLLSMVGAGGGARRENDITSLQKGRPFCLRYKVRTPPCRESVNYTLIEGPLDTRLRQAALDKCYVASQINTFAI